MNVLRVGRYRLLQRLGGGGSSHVYLAEDSLLRRKVALKLLRRRDGDERQIRHFEREARTASMLNHPNIVTVFDVGFEDDVQYIATEYVNGETLRERIDRGPMTAAEAVEIGAGVAGALAVAHEAWIVHRDIKPENLMLRPDGVVKVLDFGVAALTGDGDRTDPLRRGGTLAGTLHYLSPEQVRGEAIIDTRSDIYSLGVVLYEMLAGRRPFTGATPIDVLAAIVEEEAKPLPATVPAALRDVVNCALRKNLYERQQTASDLHAQLTEIRFQLMLRDRATRSASA
ncbi:MAG TPA: serine/threonine-protein kinase [Thermoanaerobaculia bacterium]|nr:serine/threonine-protein kinase [Thermoanaerobaculia bacterium]